MKRAILIVLLCLFGRTFSFCQCAVAVCYETGAWGVGFQGRYFEPLKSEEYYRKAALDECKSKGGTDCKVLGYNNLPGLYMFISGKSRSGKIVFAISSAKKDYDEARNDVVVMFETLSEHNSADHFKWYYWRVPSDAGVQVVP